MKIDILASGSGGNCAAVYSGKKIVLIDCGLSAKKILELLGGKLPNAILITHEHSDHAKAAEQFLRRGVDIFATNGTIEALDLPPRHNLHVIKAGIPFDIGVLLIKPIKSVHDADEPVNFHLTDTVDSVVFITDTGQVPNVHGVCSQIFIEANYSEADLDKSDIDPYQKRRIEQNHLSIEQVEAWLRSYPYAFNVNLIHLSSRHSNSDEFIRRVRKVTRGRVHAYPQNTLHETPRCSAC